MLWCLMTVWLYGQLACLLYFPLSAAVASPTTADLAIVNARVWTGDRGRPWAEAVAAAGERILVVGSNADIRAVAGPSTRVIDARQALVTPGLIDSHIHLMSFELSKPFPPIWLRFLRNRQSVADRVAAYAAELPKGAWILGHGWVDSLWGGQMPSRRWLDQLAPEHPVWLWNEAGDAGIANTAALRLAGITRDTPDEPPGAVVRDRRGEATGVIRGGPMWRIDAAVAARSRERDEGAVLQAIDNLIRAGITSVHHNNSWYDFLVLRRLRETGRLRIRVYASPGLPGWRRLRDYIRAHGRGDSWMHWGAVKGYGAIKAEAYYPWVSGASQAGIQIMCHVGSGADLRALLSVYERVRREQNLRDPRFRVEHSHDFPLDAIPIMVEAGALVSWQPPLLLHADQRTRAGQPPPGNLFPCRAVLEAGAKIAFGSDWGVARFQPLESLQIALERAAPDGTRLSFDEALRAYTLDAAYAEFAEREKGSLEPGKLADFVVFDRDFSNGPITAINDAKVRVTVIGGRAAYESQLFQPR